MKYTPGLLAGQLSGKAGNTVASRNRNGSYFRTRTIPKLVRNDFTTGVRDAFTSLSQSFRELSSDQVIGWNNLGDQVSRRNSLGQSFRLTGLQAFKSINQRLLLQGQPIFLDPPQLESAPDSAPYSVTLDRNVAILTTTVVAGATSAVQHVTSSAGVEIGDLFDDTTASVTATVLEVVDGTHVRLSAVVTTVTADAVSFTRPAKIQLAGPSAAFSSAVTFWIYATAPLSAGVSRPSKSAFRLFRVLPGNIATPAEVTENYIAKFGPVPPSTNVFYRIVVVSANGFASTPHESLMVAA